MKINKKFEPYIFTVIMAFGMSFMMSFVISLMNMGFVDHFFSIWIKSWVPAFFIALIPAFFMGKIARIVLNKIIDR
jgi:uncharacterized membrane protein YjjP (DUF1212 family)